MIGQCLPNKENEYNLLRERGCKLKKISRLLQICFCKLLIPLNVVYIFFSFTIYFQEDYQNLTHGLLTNENCRHFNFNCEKQMFIPFLLKAVDVVL